MEVICQRNFLKGINKRLITERVNLTKNIVREVSKKATISTKLFSQTESEGIFDFRLNSWKKPPW